ncbi:hypothetical protein HBH42_118270 [Parastagonospora nodorum]|nr:hypothetical protein HBH42_118270 [Parastagonospora nodorum]
MAEQPLTPGSAFSKRHVSGMLRHLEGDEQRAKAQDMAAAYERMFAESNWGAVVARIRDVADEDHLRVKDEQDPASSSVVEEDTLATPPAHTISLPSSAGSRPRVSTREKWDVRSPGPETPLSATPGGNAFAIGGFWEQLTPKKPAPDTPTTPAAPAPASPYSPIVPQDRRGRKAYKRAKDQVDRMALSICAKRLDVSETIKDSEDVPMSLATMQDCLTGALRALEFNQVNLETTIDPGLPKLMEVLAHEEKKIVDEYSIRDASALLDPETWLQVDATTAEVYTLYDAQRELMRMHCSRRKSKALKISEQATDQAWITRIFEDAERMYESADDDSDDETGYVHHNFLGSIKDIADSSSDLASISDCQSPKYLTSLHSSSSLQLSRETTLESQRSSASQIRSPYGHSAQSSASPAKPSFAHQLRTRENSLSHSPSPEKVAQSHAEHVKFLRSRKSSLSQSQTSSPETPSHTHLLNYKTSFLSPNQTPNKLRKLPPPARDDSVPNSPSLERLRKIQSKSQADLLTNEPSPEKSSFGQVLRQTKSNFSLAASFEKLRWQPTASQQSAESEDSIPPLPPFPHQLLSRKRSLSQHASSETLCKFPVPSRESSPFNDPDPEQSSHAQQLRAQKSNLSLYSVSQALEDFPVPPRENDSAAEKPSQAHSLRSQPSTLSCEDGLRKKYRKPREQDSPRTLALENPSHTHQLRAQASNISLGHGRERSRRLDLQHLQSRSHRASSPIPSPENSPYAHGRLSPKSDLAYSVKQMNKVLAEDFPQTVLTDPSGPRPGGLFIFADQPIELPQVSPKEPGRLPPPPPQTSAPETSRKGRRPPPSRIITYTDQPVDLPKVSPEERRHRRMAASQTDLSAWAGELKKMEDRASAQKLPHRVASREAIIDHVRGNSIQRSDSMESIEKFALEAIGRSPRPRQEQQVANVLPFRHPDRLRQDAQESINNSTPPQQQDVTSDLPFRRPDRLRQDGLGRANNALPPQQQHPLVSELRHRRHDRFRTESMETHHDSAPPQRQQFTENHPPRNMGRLRFESLAGINNSPLPQHQLIGNPPPRRSNGPRQETLDSKYFGSPHARHLDRPGQDGDAALQMDNMNNSHSPQQQETFGDLRLRGFERNRLDTGPADITNNPAPKSSLRSPVQFAQGPQEYTYITAPSRQRAPSDLGLRRRNAGRIAPPRHLVNNPVTPSSATPNDPPSRPRNFSQSNTPEARPWPTDDSPMYPSTPRRRPQPSPGPSLASSPLPASATLSARIHAKIAEVREGIRRIEENDRRRELRRLEREENVKQWDRDNPDWDG